MSDGLLVITTSYPCGAPGSEAAGGFVEDWVKSLNAHVPVTVVAPGKGNAISVESGINVYHYVCSQIPLSTLDAGNPRHWPAIAKILLSGMAATRRAVAEVHPRHVLAMWALPSGYWAQRMAMERDIPYSVWALGSDIWSLSRIWGIRRQLRQVFRRATYCFADGYGLVGDVTAIAGRQCMFMPSCRALLSKSTPPLRRVSPPYRLAYLGRWHPNKGTDLLLEALAMLHREDWARIEEVRIAGGGPQEALVSKRIEQLYAHTGKVNQLGFLGRDQAVDLLDWADYLVIPSRIESIPVVLSDALQRGCPVITTPVGDMPRLIDEYKVGLMAEAITAESIATVLRSALGCSPREFSRDLQNARGVFDINSISRKFLNMVENKKWC